MTINKINISETLKNAGIFLKEDNDVTPQVRAMMELMIVVINLLVAKLGLNSKNSSTPPSKDPQRRRGSKRKTKCNKRKPGGQNGHVGTTLKKVPDPDVVETIEIDRRTIPSDQ